MNLDIYRCDYVEITIISFYPSFIFVVIPAKAGIQSEKCKLGSPGVPEDDRGIRMRK
jgi:hypothetical protein